MSTDHGLYCRDCKKRRFLNNGWHTGWKTIQEIWAARDSLARVAAFVREVGKIPVSSLEISVSLDYGSTNEYDLFQFLEEHKGHDLVIMDEYGYLRDENHQVLGEVDLFEEEKDPITVKAERLYEELPPEGKQKANRFIRWLVGKR